MFDWGFDFAFAFAFALWMMFFADHLGRLV
jgi:hypothetical protein